MDYYTLLDLTTELGYDLAMSGAETFRVEDTIRRIMNAYSIEAEVFAIPNNLIVSIEGENRKPMTRMRRIGFHGNDLDGVERFNALSRRICDEKPEPLIALQWLHEEEKVRQQYSFPVHILGGMVGSAGYAVFFGGNWQDFLCAGICGMLVGFINHFMNKLKVNQFFSTMLSAFIMAVAAYAMGAMGIVNSCDCVVIGTLMILLPGLIFTNALRDIIYGDTNSGINRIIQVLLIAAAIALGTGAAWNLAKLLWGVPVSAPAIAYPIWVQCLSASVGCIGFTIVFNIHGRGKWLCMLGSGLTCAVFGLTVYLTANETAGYFAGAVFSAAYAETMARIRKYPTLSYLVISIFPLIPGAGIYYTTNYLLEGDMTGFADRGTNTIAIAGAIAVGILVVSTIVNFWNVRHRHKGR